MLQFFVKPCLCLVIILQLSACDSILRPKPFGMSRNMIDGAPAGSPGFRYGWREGCKSGMAAYGSLHYKMMYGYSYDSTALHDDEYQYAWELGFRHCRWYTSSWVS